MSNRLYTLSDDREKPVEAKLLYVTSAKYENDWHSTLHTHYFTEFFYVLHGEGRFWVEDTTFPVRENDMVIINPNVPHTELSLADRPLEYIVLGIDGVFFPFISRRRRRGIRFSAFGSSGRGSCFISAPC